MKPTNAFEYYIDEVLLIQNYLQRYVTTTADEYGNSYMKLDEYSDEERVRFGICKNIINKIEELLDLNILKKQYNTAVKKLTNLDLDYSNFFAKKQKLDDELMTLARFEYCKNKYKKENYIRNDLQVLGYLSAILIKLQNKYNLSNPNQEHKMFSRTILYKYIKFANLEEDQIDITNYSKYSVQELMEKLYNITINYDYEQENKTVEPALAIEHDNDDTNSLGHYVQDFYHVHIDEGDNTLENYRKQKEQEIYDWLIHEMHTLEDGRIF